MVFSESLKALGRIYHAANPIVVRYFLETKGKIMINVTIAKNEAEIRRALAVRHAVWCGEQDIPIDTEIDTYDYILSAHILGEVDGKATAYCRLRSLACGAAKIEHLCILAKHRKNIRLLRKLTDLAVETAREYGYVWVVGTPTERMARFWGRFSGATLSKKPVGTLETTDEALYWCSISLNPTVTAQPFTYDRYLASA